VARCGVIPPPGSSGRRHCRRDRPRSQNGRPRRHQTAAAGPQARRRSAARTAHRPRPGPAARTRSPRARSPDRCAGPRATAGPIWKRDRLGIVGGGDSSSTSQSGGPVWTVCSQRASKPHRTGRSVRASLPNSKRLDSHRIGVRRFL